jgi:putative sterol carrier protein
MKILVVRGNPRKDGYTGYVTDLVVRGMREGGAELVDIDLAQKQISQCVGCYKCWTATPGRCILRDDMDALLPTILDADVVVCATPLYYYTMSAGMKTFLERTFPLAKPGLDTTPRGLAKNSLRYPERWPKRLIPIIVGAFKSYEDFRPTVETFQLIADGLSMGWAGTIIRPESYLLQFSLAKPKTVKTVETALVRAGLELATAGAIGPDTEEKVRTPLAIDEYHFTTYSKIFWEHMLALGAEADDLVKVQRRVTSDVRILMREMARSIDPAATARLKAVLQFDFPDKELHFCIRVDRGSCVLSEETAQKPDLRVTASTDVWAQAFMREISMEDALMSRKVLLEGDKSLFSRLDRYFPPPVS